MPPPALCVYESHTEFAERIGAAAHGVDSLTASYLVVTNDHVGTHLDARKHIVPTAGGPDTIPLEYCMSDGVLLDFTDKPSGYVITTDDVKRELERIEYTLKDRDIVLNHTGAAPTTPGALSHGPFGHERRRDPLAHLAGVRLMGCDAITYDPPVWAMFEQGLFWEADRVMWDEEYWTSRT